MLTTEELFDAAKIEMQGPVEWGTQIPQSGSGIYVITTLDSKSAPRRLDEVRLKRWIPDEKIVYIGRSKNVRRRLNQFYRHKHGAARPHRGGQDILLLESQLQVYWGSADTYQKAEEILIEAFRFKVNAIPFANRMRASRPAL